MRVFHCRALRPDPIFPIRILIPDFSIGAGVYRLDYDIFDNRHNGLLFDRKKRTYIIVDDSEPGKGDGFYSLYVAREAIANVHGGNFASVRIAVFNGNEDDPASAFGYCYLYGGKYSSKGVNQSGEDLRLK